MRRALITGISGQDGSYLAQLLLEQGYDVAGVVRDPVDRDFPHLGEAQGRISLVPGDLTDPRTLVDALGAIRPHELYHLAAPTFVPTSWEDPTRVLAEIAGATGELLGAARRLDPDMRVFVATSSEIFGDAGESPQHERSPMRPRSPYGVAKLAAHGLVGALRERFGTFAVSGITYNHESPRRPAHFLPRKVTRGAAAIALGLDEELVLGDLDAVRDWSHAADVMRGAWLALQADAPRDYVFASGRGRTVRELVETAFAAAGVPPDGRVRVDPSLVRGPEPTPPVGDPSRARRELGWGPEIAFEAMIAEMVEADLAELRMHRIVIWAGIDAWRAEEARLALTAGGVRAEGTQIGVDPGPYRMTYALDASEGWLTRRLAVRLTGADGRERSVLLEHDGDGAWRVDGDDAPALQGALDCDLGFSPLTNLMPLRRHRLHERAGEVDLLMAWVDVPSLAVVPYRQRYTHVGPGRARFASLDVHEGFTAELELDADGLIERYPGLARRVAQA